MVKYPPITMLECYLLTEGYEGDSIYVQIERKITHLSGEKNKIRFLCR